MGQVFFSLPSSSFPSSCARSVSVSDSTSVVQRPQSPSIASIADDSARPSLAVSRSDRPIRSRVPALTPPSSGACHAASSNSHGFFEYFSNSRSSLHGVHLGPASFGQQRRFGQRRDRTRICRRRPREEAQETSSVRYLCAFLSVKASRWGRKR